MRYFLLYREFRWWIQILPGHNIIFIDQILLKWHTKYILKTVVFNALAPSDGIDNSRVKSFAVAYSCRLYWFIALYVFSRLQRNHFLI